MGEHTGLAGPRAGEDRERPSAARDRGALGVVETREEIGHRCTVPKGYATNGDDAARVTGNAAKKAAEKEEGPE